MPQLDKVTLFSQIFWLIFLYFFFFLLFLKYYLPKISKLFKIRVNYTNFDLDLKPIKSVGVVYSILKRFQLALFSNIKLNVTYYRTMLNHYNFVVLGEVNVLFISFYAYSCLKFKLYKKLYL